MQTIELFIKDDEDGVFAISLVNSPAIEENFVTLSKDDPKYNIELKGIDDERKIVVGFALVPEKPIYRKMKDKEFNIKFSKETVAKASELYMKNLNLANVTSEHKKPVKDCCVIESWIVEDAKNDKSNIWDLGAKGGEWVIVMKLYNEEEYQKAKDGTYNGFSIEAMFDGFEQLNTKELTDEEKLNKIIEILD